MSITLLQDVVCERCGSHEMRRLDDRIVGCRVFLFDDGRIVGWCQFSGAEREQFRQEQDARRQEQAARQHDRLMKARVPPP